MDIPPQVLFLLRPLRWYAFEYVDDADIVASGSTNHSTGPQILFKMQSALDAWDGLPRAVLWKSQKVIGI